MASPTAPVRVPSISGPTPTHSQRHRSLSDDISHLSASEVRDRLERNWRVLTSSTYSLPLADWSSPSSSVSTSTLPPDSTRDHLLAARDALLARHEDLTLTGMQGLSFEDKIVPSNPRSGKARALAAIRQQEREGGQRSHVLLPIDSSLALSERDYDNAAMARLSNMTLEPSRSSSGRGRRRPDRADRYRDGLEDDIFPSDEAFAEAQIAEGDADDQGNGMPMAKVQWGRNTDGDEVGEDMENQQFSEGNDEYAEMEK